MYKVHIHTSDDDSSLRGCYVLTGKRLPTSSEDRNALIFRVEVKLSNCFSVTLEYDMARHSRGLETFLLDRCENVKCLFYCVELFVLSLGNKK